MDKLKITFGVVFGIVGVIVTTILIWLLLFLVVPDVKDQTQKLFKWGDYAVEEVVEESESSTPAEIEIPEITPIEDETEVSDFTLEENITIEEMQKAITQESQENLLVS